MHLIRVVPIAKGIAREELSYYAKHAHEPGTVLRVPLRNRQVPALVSECKPVREAKQEIRDADYALRRIDSEESSHLFDQATIRAARALAEYHATTTGAVLIHLLPAALVETTYTASERTAPDTMYTGGERVIQATRHARAELYKTTVREAFAHRQSVLIVAPTRAEAEHLFTTLAAPLHGHAYLLHSGLTPRAQRDTWRKALENEHPVLVVATYGFAALPRHDLGYMVVERESSPQYRTGSRPYVHMSDFVRRLASERRIAYLAADLPLSVETMARVREGHAEEIVAGHGRTSFSADVTLYDARRVPDTPAPKQFRVLAPEVTQTIAEGVAHHKRILVYCARRGLAPMTICQDCEETVACKNCGASVTLHASGGNENFFLCHSCGTMRHARERCVRCQSWRLTTLGIAVEGVARELTTVLPPRTAVATLSSDTVKTHVQALSCVENFYEKGGVLVCTEMALPYLHTPIDVGVIASLDSLLALPAWNMHERIAGITTRLRELSQEILIVQTRRPQSTILGRIAKGDYKGYYADELEVRRQLGYPPFMRLIKLTVRGTHEHVTERTRMLTETLAQYQFETVSHFLRGPRGEYVMHGFLRCEAEAWPKSDLTALLRRLPPDVTIRIDPDSVL